MGSSIEQVFDQRNGHAVAIYRVSARDRRRARLWHLLASPAAWPRWAPHIRRVTTATGAPTVAAGDTVRIDGWGPVHVTASITRVDEASRWDFRVDLPAGHRLDATHEIVGAGVTPAPDGPDGASARPLAVQVRMALRGPLPRAAGVALLTAYRPLATVALRRLVDLAADDT